MVTRNGHKGYVVQYRTGSRSKDAHEERAYSQRRLRRGASNRQRFTLRQTRRTVPITFSIMLVQASERRSSFGNPSRVTVRIQESNRGPRSG
jgi:hypothetical protein